MCGPLSLPLFVAKHEMWMAQFGLEKPAVCAMFNVSGFSQAYSSRVSQSSLGSTRLTRLGHAVVVVVPMPMHACDAMPSSGRPVHRPARRSVTVSGAVTGSLSAVVPSTSDCLFAATRQLIYFESARRRAIIFSLPDPRPSRHTPAPTARSSSNTIVCGWKALLGYDLFHSVHCNWCIVRSARRPLVSDPSPQFIYYVRSCNCEKRRAQE